MVYFSSSVQQKLISNGLSRTADLNLKPVICLQFPLLNYYWLLTSIDSEKQNMAYGLSYLNQKIAVGPIDLTCLDELTGQDFEHLSDNYLIGEEDEENNLCFVKVLDNFKSEMTLLQYAYQISRKGWQREYSLTV